MRDIITQRALELFDRRGYYGAAIRDICEASGCKMPTLYYYFANKDELFDQVVRVQFEELVDRLESEIPAGLSLEEACAYRIVQKKGLSDKDRLVYRLAIKTWVGLEGCELIRLKMALWDRARGSRCRKPFADAGYSRAWIKFIARSVANLDARIVLLDENPPDEEIRETVAGIFAAAKSRG